MTSKIDIETAQRQLSADGFVVIPSVIEASALQKLRDRVALFYQAWEKYPASTRKEISAPAPGDAYQPVKEINWPRAALALLDDEPAVIAIRQVVDALAGDSCKIIHVNSLLKPAHNGAPVAPHQDTAYNLFDLNHPLTAWIPFGEVSETNGALFYVPGSHKLGDLEHESSGQVRWLAEAQMHEIDKPIVQYAAAPGAIGIHDSRVVHGSYPNRSAKDRLALSLRFEVVSG